MMFINKNGERLFNFGKYRNIPVIEIIKTHIGYIGWCFNNILDFSLNEKEQEIFDIIALTIIKYYNEGIIELKFPINILTEHIKDKTILDKPHRKINNNIEINRDLSPFIHEINKTDLIMEDEGYSEDDLYPIENPYSIIE